MLRSRRYRVLLVFAVIFVLSFIHFSRSRDWSSIIVETNEGHSPESANPADQLAKTDSSASAGKVDSNSLPKDPPKSNSPVSSSSGNKNKPEWPATSSSETKENQAPGGDSHSSTPGKTLEKVTTKVSTKILEKEEIDNGGTGRVVAKHPNTGISAPRWKKFPERFPVSMEELIKLPKDQPKVISRLQAKFKDETTSDKQERLQRLSAIAAEFKHAWQGYKKVAMGHDELKPLTAEFEDPFNGWGATLVDSLDTLYIMGMKEEFTEAVDTVGKIDFTTSPREDIPMFETVIRYLGGLLGAYDISGQRHAVLLEKAEQLAEVLIGAFDTPNRMPVLYYRWTPDHVDRPHRASSRASLAELGSLSLEFTRLAQLTKRDKYYDAIARVTNELEKLQDDTSLPGLWPTRLNAQGCAKYEPLLTDPVAEVGAPTRKSPDSSTTKGEPTSASLKRSVPTESSNPSKLISRDPEIDLSVAEPAVYGSEAEAQTDTCDGGLLLPTALRDNKYTLAGLADSTYEYLPKEYLLLGGVKDQYKKMYKKAMDAARGNLLFRPMIKGGRDVRFMASTNSLDPSSKGVDPSRDIAYESHHLTCFVGGMMAIGAKTFGIEGDMDIASKLTDGCVWAYETTTTGLMPERFRLMPCGKGKACDWDEASYDAEVKRFGHISDSEAEAKFRSGETAYGQSYGGRVKLNADTESKKSGTNDHSVPLPMPGSQNPHDQEPASKRDILVGGGFANVSAAAPPAGSDETERIENRDTPRIPQSPALSKSDPSGLLPSGMVSIPSAQYYLRPEAIESVFIMFRITGDEAWRRKGWNMFEAIVKHTRTELAHAAIGDVMSQKPTQKDTMESFWLAETLKYFYLLFSDPSVVDLDKYVLNTEAHPFLRPT
ncbi:hypothetical protein N7495_003611 [Penicillium taxi]|uniref:uncharacterized protein n=1 Tax=Penicillium taxi TaxID=168475 RepID=UPI00254530A3|nr:uncharacterized protein N7495_003611 [Penicillium taxi]KAJ5898867.1 hypothetical protein N7495_003611 [Penicillium taxi]